MPAFVDQNVQPPVLFDHRIDRAPAGIGRSDIQWNEGTSRLGFAQSQ
jgi:hypothetical protein